MPRTTVYEYFEILKETLILFELPAWRKSIKRKPLASSKYYFFDVGVVSALQGRELRPGTPEFGQGLETYLMHELTSHADHRSEQPLGYWRSMSGFESTKDQRSGGPSLSGVPRSAVGRGVPLIGGRADQSGPDRVPPILECGEKTRLLWLAPPHFQVPTTLKQFLKNQTLVLV